MKWTYEYQETGGYDCMTGAYVIKMGQATICTMDMADYGQEPCDYSFKPDKETEEIAMLIAASKSMLKAIKALEVAAKLMNRAEI